MLYGNHKTELDLVHKMEITRRNCNGQLTRFSQDSEKPARPYGIESFDSQDSHKIPRKSDKTVKISVLN